MHAYNFFSIMILLRDGLMNDDELITISMLDDLDYDGIGGMKQVKAHSPFLLPPTKRSPNFPPSLAKQLKSIHKPLRVSLVHHPPVGLIKIIDQQINLHDNWILMITKQVCSRIISLRELITAKSWKIFPPSRPRTVMRSGSMPLKVSPMSRFK